jgi:hypothetical protein
MADERSNGGKAIGGMFAACVGIPLIVYLLYKVKESDIHMPHRAAANHHVSRAVGGHSFPAASCLKHTA